MKPAPYVEGEESPALVLLVGLLILVFGVQTLLWVYAFGWVFSFLLAVVLLAVAWFLPTTRSARALRWMFGALGVIALLLGAFDFVDDGPFRIGGGSGEVSVYSDEGGQ